jgi:predicted transcriptional regulator
MLIVVEQTSSLIPMAKSSHPSTAEFRVLDVLWASGPSTVRAVADAVYGSAEPVQYRTVQVQLDRLEKKGLVTRDRTAPAHLFSAAFPRDRFLGDQLKDLAERVCGGSLTPLLLNLAQAVDLTDAQRRELWELLGEEPER